VGLRKGGEIRSDKVFSLFWPRLFDLASVAGHPTSRAEGQRGGDRGRGQEKGGSGCRTGSLSASV